MDNIYGKRCSNPKDNTMINIIIEEELIDDRMQNFDYSIIDGMNPFEAYTRLAFMKLYTADGSGIEYYIDINKQNKQACIFIGQLYVNERERRNGIGITLIQTCLEHFESISNGYTLDKVYGILAFKDYQLGNWNLSVPFYKSLNKYIHKFKFNLKVFNKKTRQETDFDYLINNQEDGYFEINIENTN